MMENMKENKKDRMTEHKNKKVYKWWQKALLSIGILLIVAGMGLFFLSAQSGIKAVNYTKKQEAPAPLQGTVSLETILNFSTKQCIIKLCLGCYKGALYDTLLEIINDLGNNSSSTIKKLASSNIKSWEGRYNNNE